MLRKSTTLIIALSAFLPAQALAYECIVNSNYTGGPTGCSPTACRWQGGHSLTWHIVDGKFTTSEENAIEDGADAWESGSGDLNRGANWTFNRGSDTANGDASITDGRYDVFTRTDTWFSNQGLGASTIAVAVLNYGSWPACGVTSGDIAFRDSVTWSTSLPQALDQATSTRSIGQTAIHEFGHILGLDHEDDVLATMNSIYPLGGDISATYRINEDDYVGLESEYSHSSTGKNLQISKFHRTGSGTSAEAGSTFYNRGPWSASPGDVLTGSDRPYGVNVILTGTTSLNNVEVRWRLRPTGSTCGAADNFTLGTKTYNLGVNTPYLTNMTNWSIPLGIPAGSYKVCIEIDPDDDFSEVKDNDNTVVFDKIFTIF